jgi:hypothetical protein
MNISGEFLLRHFSVLLACSICVSAHASPEYTLPLIVIALLLDYARRHLAPDIKLSSIERRNLMILSSTDERLQEQYKQKLRYPTGLVYRLWYLGAIIIMLSYGSLPQVVVHILTELPDQFYRFSNDNLLSKAFLMPARVNLTKEMYSFSWDVFFLGTIFEVCGGAFYFVNSNKLRNRSLWNEVGTKKQVLGILCFSIVALVFLYSTPGIMAYSEIIGYYGNLAPDSNILFIVTIFVSSYMLQAAGQCVRLVYVAVLYMSSGEFTR